MRKPGHREGVRRYQRYGQLTLAVGKTLDAELEKFIDENAQTSFGVSPEKLLHEMRKKPSAPQTPCAVCNGRSCEFCPKVRP